MEVIAAAMAIVIMVFFIACWSFSALFFIGAFILMAKYRMEAKKSRKNYSKRKTSTGRHNSGHYQRNHSCRSYDYGNDMSFRVACDDVARAHNQAVTDSMRAAQNAEFHFNSDCRNNDMINDINCFNDFSTSCAMDFSTMNMMGM